MTQYIGTKTIQACPMTSLKAEEMLERKLSDVEEDGYLVKYEDGYLSWSPKEVFEKTYKIAETPEDRIIIEHSDLNDNLNRLTQFTKSESFNHLPKSTQAMLLGQMDIMSSYIHILAHRYGDMKRAADGAELCGYNGMTFSETLILIKHGFCVRRRGWNGSGLFVFRQKPAVVPADVIPQMTSLYDEAKNQILATQDHIDYTAQMLIFNTGTGRADSWVPSSADLFADDWDLVI